MSDNTNIIKARITKLKTRIEKLGATVPEDILTIESHEEREQALKAFLETIEQPEDRPAEGQFQTNEEAKESINEILLKRLSEMETRLKEQDDALRKFALNNDSNAKMGLINEEYIPPHDMLEKPEVFYVPSSSHNIWGKRVGNHFTPPPMNIKFIKFKQAWGWTTREGTALKQKRIATYECFSKSISEWLKSLPEFGRVFYLDIDEAINNSSDLTFAQAYAMEYGRLQGLPLAKLTQMAQMEGLPTSAAATGDQYAGMLAERAVKNQLRRQQEALDNQARTAKIQDLIVTPK